MLSLKYNVLIINLLFLCLTSMVVGRSASGHFSQNVIKEKLKASSVTSTTATNNEQENVVNDINNDFWSDIWDLYKLYKQCSNNNITVCLKIKLLTNLEKIVNNNSNLKILNGIQFIEDDQSARTMKEQKNLKILSESEIEASLPRSMEDKDQTLNNLIFNKILSFLKSHTLQIKIPSSMDMERSLNESDETEEGRKKKDKKNQAAFIMIPLLIKGFIVPLAFGALSLLAGKALIVSKLALVLASIIGIKKLLSHGAKETQHEVVVAGGHGGSGWGRDIDLAYDAYNNPELKHYKEF